MLMKTAALVVSIGLASAMYGADPVAPNAYIQHNLVSDQAGKADVTDPNLVNPWGISESSASPFWISNNHSGNTTLYNGSGAIIPLVVTIPLPAGQTGLSSPTGQVATNGVQAFQLANGKPAVFIFDSEDGTIAAWNGGAAATLMVDNSASGAVYKGLALGANASGPLLYAANFHAGTVDVFDGTFKPATVAGGFKDSTIPAGFAPFNVANLGGKLYVAYAKQDDEKHDDVAGAGNGFVNVFDMDGNLQKRLVSNGPLNSPWGLAIAPATFGAFPGALLVGNFGSGNVNAIDPAVGTVLGTLADTKGNPIAIEGLWALQFGNGKNGGDQNTLYFTAGPGDESHGLFGSIAPPAAISGILNAASNTAGPIAPGEAVTLTGLTIGPSPLVAAQFSSSKPLESKLAGAGVTFNGTPGAVLYASASQTAVMVPYELSGATSVNVEVSFQGQTTASFPVSMAPAAPGLFTSDASGSGQALAFNADGTVNGEKNAAASGSVIILFATGEGLTNPGGEDGVVTTNILHTPQLPVSLTIGGKTAEVTYAGSAPGLVEGVMQVEAIVPQGAGTGDVAVVLTVGTVNSQSGVTIALQ